MKKSLLVLPLIAALFAVSAVDADSPTQVEGATTVDAATAKALFDRGVPFVDVRGGGDYSFGHIPRAVNLGLRTAFGEAELAKVASKDQGVVMYCDGPTGNRSSRACERAGSWGGKKGDYCRGGLPGGTAAG